MVNTSEEVKDINVLLLGESGVGKSTFINSCYNYFKHPLFDDVLSSKLEVLIPAKFEIADANYEQQTVTLGDMADTNECFEDAAAATQDVKIYNFPIEIKGKMFRLRLMDTPGIGDQRGADQDKYNCERVLNVLSRLKEVHGFCLLLKPTNARLDVFMNYCISQLLSRLESSAVDNIFFVFTNSRGENFSPGKTYVPLKKLVQKYKEESNVTIPLSRSNTFCFDNEGFRFVGAIKNGVEMDEFIYPATELSWNKSSKELWRMIEYVVNIQPHDLSKTMMINESKMIASELNRPLCEILSIIQDNLRRIEATTKELEDAKLTYEEFDKIMRRPQYKLKIIPTNNRQTVCEHSSCIQIIEENGVGVKHYKKICCVDCQGAQVFCTSLNPRWNPCKVCRHPYNTHNQIRYKTKVILVSLDESMLPEVNRQSDLVKVKKEYLKSLQTSKQEFEEERHLILETCAIIKLFLKSNSIVAKDDPTDVYLNCQMTSSSPELVNNAKEILLEYNKMKHELDKIVIGDRKIKPEEIKERKEQLFGLKHFGDQVKNAILLKESEMDEDVSSREIRILNECFKKPAI